MATKLLSVSYIYVLGPRLLDLMKYKSVKSRRARGAHSYVIFFLSIAKIKFAKFYTEAFQPISPNLMMSRYTVWLLCLVHMNCIIGAAQLCTYANHLTSCMQHTVHWKWWQHSVKDFSEPTTAPTTTSDSELTLKTALFWLNMSSLGALCIIGNRGALNIISSGL